MSEKKPKKKSAEGTKSKSNVSPPSVDPRVTEKTMSEIGKLLEEQKFNSIDEANAFLKKIMASGKVPSSPKLTPLEKAQDLMYKAWESSGKRRVELAHQALEISEDCADAYVLLAEEAARNLNEAKNLYEQGMKAGERALGPEVFKKDAGHFWGITETRSYMRARAGLAQCLWELGEQQQAIEHYTDMLRLNPNDNQGVRYILVNWLFEAGSDKALGKLLEEYKEDGVAAWLYSLALWTFRQKGASSKANASLEKALKFNRFVPIYLLGRKKLPKRLPEYIGIGDENEAIDYAVGAIEVWYKTPGALEWLLSYLLNELK